MRRQLIVVSVSLLVVLAGCSALTDSQTADAAQQTTTTPPTTSTTPPTTSSATTTTQVAKNPWGADELTVYVESELDDRNYTALAAHALSYWNTNADTRAGNDYRVTPTLTLTDTPENADITITYRPVLECQGVTKSIGDVRAYCTDYYQPGDSPDGTTEIVVTSRYENNTTIGLTTNALGGLYGRTTGDPPVSIPRQPNLTDPFITADTVVVAIQNEVNSRNYTPMVQQALDYWMANDDQYGTYTTDFVLKPDAEDPDLVVHVREEVSYCGIREENTTLGCADVLNKQQGTTSPARVVVKSGYTDASATTILKHELGHIYGLGHGSTPAFWMEAHFDADELPRTDAREQVNPWTKSPVTISVADDAYTGARPAVVEGVKHVVEYYNEHADADGFSLRYIEDESEADIVVAESHQSSSPCLTSNAASCGLPYGYSVDADDSLETYTRMIIHTHGIDTDRVAWHVGYWIDTTITPDEFEEPWDEPRSDPRSNWW